MACLLKFPVDQSKGIATFTTPEWRLIQENSDLVSKLNSIRSDYVTGLHFNWHDYRFDPPPEFDFFMAGAEDLRPINNKPWRLLPMDACNFTPKVYRPANANEKFWDVLIVGNPVFFKRPEIVLKTIRELFDRTDRPLQVLYICPIPNYRLLDEDTVLFDVRAYYEALFTIDERTRFTLLTTTFDSPNPFDRKTLSVFFRNSKVFLHCAIEERRCRIAAYAWAAGLPVVAYPSVGSILPSSLRQPPGFFCVNNDGEYVDALLKAIANAHSFDASLYRAVISETETVNSLENELRKIFCDLSIPYADSLLSHNLDRRLGWHHQGISGLSNGLNQPLSEFMLELMKPENRTLERKNMICSHEYPERVLANELDSTLPGSVVDVVRSSIYLNPRKRRWVSLYKSIKARLL